MQPIDILVLSFCILWLLGSLLFLLRRRGAGGCCGCSGCASVKKSKGAPPKSTCTGHCEHCSACASRKD